jgi:hypothetical protein
LAVAIGRGRGLLKTEEIIVDVVTDRIFYG